MLVGWIVSRVLLNLFYCWIFYSAMSSNMLNLHTSLLLFHLAVGCLTLLSPVPDGLQACRRSTSNLIEPLLNCPKHSEWLMQEASSLWTLSFCQASNITPSSQKMVILGLHVRKIHSGIILRWVFLWCDWMNADEDKTQQSRRLSGFSCHSVYSVHRIQRVSLRSHVFVLNLEWSKSMGGRLKQICDKLSRHSL